MYRTHHIHHTHLVRQQYSPKPKVPLYRPLYQACPTRLLALQPGEYPEPLSATLHEVSLDDEPSYECLSYTWGEDLDTSTITINGTPIQIRRNLCQFLRRIRLSGRPRVLWVDAISISQNDLNEKAMQVEMIGSIFSSARRVLVWLGEHAEGSEVLFQGLPERPQPHWFWGQSRLLAQDVKPRGDQGTVSVEESEHMSRVWTAFLSRPYFSRTWIIQEVVLAKDLVCHCGPDVGGWDDLLGERLDPRMRESISTNATATEGHSRAPNVLARVLTMSNTLKPVSNLLEARVLYGSQDHQQQLPKTPHYAELRETKKSTVLLSTLAAHTRCADRRDKVYALLSIDPSKMLQNEIGVDYTITAVELYVKVLRALARMDGEVLPEWMMPTTAGGSNRRRDWVRMAERLRKQIGLDSTDELMEIVDEMLDICEAGQIPGVEELRMAVEASREAIEELKTVMEARGDPRRGEIEWPPHLSVEFTRDEILRWRVKVRQEGRWLPPRPRPYAFG